MDPIALNVKGVQDLVGSKTNKIQSGASEREEGVEGDTHDEFTLDLDDDELLALAQDWTQKYKPYEATIKTRQEANKTYYLGKQKSGSPSDIEDIPIASNLLFEAEETFLPAALAKNPEPVVYADNTEQGNALAGDVKTMLQYHADVLVLRKKMALMVRHWSIYFVGVLKHGWNKELNDISLEVRNPKNFIFDPDEAVDPYGDMEGYVGERITVSARKLTTLFPKHSAYIKVMCNGQLGTNVTYTEWWNDDYCFYTYLDKVLDKHKNPHFIYDKNIPAIDMTGQPEVDQDGKPVLTTQKGKNHFAKPKKPYTFLSVFSLGEQPHDITGLIEQNIPNQNLVTQRTNQIAKNLASGNNSTAFSERYFNQQTAKQAATAMEKGHPVLVPVADGPLTEAIMRFPAPSFPQAAFDELESNKENLRSIFGTLGISSQPAKEDTTARGMILNQQYDNSRIGGGIGDALEQVADNVFNWQVQLYYVYYDTPHYASIMGQMKATEYIEFSSQDFDRRLVISVSPDSMKPHDELTEMNQAMELWSAGALDPKTLLTMLNVPNPQETSEMAVLWKIDPQAYLQLNFPEVAQQLAQIQQQAQQQAMQQEAQSANIQASAKATAQAPPGGQVPEAAPPTMGVPPAGASLSTVPLPK